MAVRNATGRELTPPKWVFVVGCYNSGTELLTELLGRHPQLQTLPREGVELTDRLPRPEQFGWPRLWLHCADELSVPVDDAARAARIKRQWSHWVKRELPIVEKSPPNLLRLEFLQRHFAPAHFIYIVRNGFAVAEGIRRKARPREWGNRQLELYAIELCARQWADADARVQVARGSLQHFHSLSYEELTEAPLDRLNKIAHFLGVEPFSADSVEAPVDVHRKRSAIANQNAGSFDRLSRDDVDAVRAAAGEKLDRYGYLHPTELSR